MTHLDTELKNLKSELLEMWTLVMNQMIKAKDALINFDKDLAVDVEINEKRVNGYEIKIDRDCENLLALYTPVAVDLRFVLAVLKINYNLERIGDYARSIAKIVRNNDTKFADELLNHVNVLEMFDLTNSLFADSMLAFEEENSRLARTIFMKDENIDKINKAANGKIGEYIHANSAEMADALNIVTIVRKLERVGDQTKGIAEEIIFYMEAKVLKHKPKQEKS